MHRMAFLLPVNKSRFASRVGKLASPTYELINNEQGHKMKQDAWFTIEWEEWSTLKEQNRNIPIGLKLLILVFAASFLIILIVMLYVGVKPTSWLRLLGYTFAFAYFTYNIEGARRRAVKSHTMNVLMNTREGAFFQENVNQYKKYRHGKKDPIPWEEFKSFDEKNNYDTESIANVIRYLINYYEYLAAGVDNGDLDEATLKNTLRGMFCGFFRATQHIIKHYNDADLKKRPLEYIIKLYRKWEDQDKYEKTVFYKVAS